MEGTTTILCLDSAFNERSSGSSVTQRLVWPMPVYTVPMWFEIKHPHHVALASDFTPYPPGARNISGNNSFATEVSDGRQTE
jgi:hypothetical protein